MREFAEGKLKLTDSHCAMSTFSKVRHPNVSHHDRFFRGSAAETTQVALVRCLAIRTCVVEGQRQRHRNVPPGIDRTRSATVHTLRISRVAENDANSWLYGISKIRKDLSQQGTRTCYTNGCGGLSKHTHRKMTNIEPMCTF